VTDLTWNEFQRVELRVGTVIAVENFPEARNPAWKLTVDFGDEIGTRRSSAQITDLYNAEELLEKQVLAVVNFPPKQIGPFMSECLVTGLIQDDGSVVLAVPDKPVRNGLRLG
jgi:tRNA-binding protein